jgi:hypothetical protein
MLACFFSVVLGSSGLGPGVRSSHLLEVSEGKKGIRFASCKSICMPHCILFSAFLILLNISMWDLYKKMGSTDSIFGRLC